MLLVDEYLEKYGLTREEVWGEDEVLATTVYEVTVWLRNNNTDMENDTQNIDLVNMQLTTNRDIIRWIMNCCGPCILNLTKVPMHSEWLRERKPQYTCPTRT